jgi:hypothetical protein
MAWSLIRNEKPIVLFENAVVQLISQRPLQVQGASSHPGKQGGGQEENNREKIEGRGGREAQGVAGPKRVEYKFMNRYYVLFFSTGIMAFSARGIGAR